MKKLLLLTLLVSTFNSFAQATCETAINITANGDFVTGAIDGTYPSGTGLCWTSASSTPNAKWYKFTPTANGVLTVTSAIAANPGGTTGVDSRLSIMTGACGGPYTCVAGNDDVADDDYRSAVNNLVVTSGTTYLIVWDDRWLNTSFTFNLTFVPQSCFIPTAFTFTAAPTTTTAGIGWTAPTSGSAPVGYQFEYGVQGFTQGTGTTLNPTTNSVSLTSLLPSTVYEFYVRTDCGTGTYSVWAGPISFATVFEPVTPPYNTGFENGNVEYIGWTAPTATAGNDWYSNNGGTGSTLVQEGSYALAGVSSTTAASNSFIISRGVNLVENQPVTVSFYVSNYRATTNTTSTANYSVTQGAGQNIASQTNVIGTQTGLSDAVFTLKTYTFTPTVAGVYYIGINNTSPINTGGGTHALLVDNFTVTQALSNSKFDTTKLNIYPNPVNNIFTIENADNLVISSLSLSDVNGRVVKTISSSASEVNIADLNAGIYFLNIATEKGNVTKKIIKN